MGQCTFQMDYNNFQPSKDLDNAAVECLAEGRNHLYEEDPKKPTARSAGAAHLIAELAANLGQHNATVRGASVDQTRPHPNCWLRSWPRSRDIVRRRKPVRAGWPEGAHVAGNTRDEIGPGCAVNCATAEGTDRRYLPQNQSPPVMTTPLRAVPPI